MKLCVFLGNIGKKYELTRHNAGFLLGDFLQKKWGFSLWKESEKFFGAVSEGIYNDEKILFLKPNTLMNRSGKAVAALVNFYKIATSDILLCADDIDLPFGTVRFREKGSSGGHNGLKDCFRALGTEELQRIKIGVHTPQREVFEDTAAFVLAHFLPAEQELLPQIWQECSKKIEEHFF